MITPAEIEQRAIDEDVEQPDAVAALARSGYRLVPTGMRTGVGASKLGGVPDLPAGVQWPLFQWRDELLPMLFLGQIALDELVGGDWFAQAGGLLSFFYAAAAKRRLPKIDSGLGRTRPQGPSSPAQC
jgi:uncharacterized protein YwqG